MTWVLTDDLETFLTAAGPLLAADPAEATIALTATELIRSGRSVLAPGSIFGWHEVRPSQPSAEVDGAVLMTAPFNLLLAVLPAGRALSGPAGLVEALIENCISVPGVSGLPEAVHEFADAWIARTGGAAGGPVNLRLYELGELERPLDVPGRARPAGPPDSPLAVAWFEDFMAEAEPHGPANPAAELIESAIAAGELWLWEDTPAGADTPQPVSMANRRPVIAGMSRIGPVYTPPEHRRHGYAAAVTAAATQAARDDGARTIVLFTDLTNPTSNAIYQQIGYRPRSDRLQLTFTESPPPRAL